MCPPAASTPFDIDFASTDEELLISLERIIRGSGLPSNVLDDVNPYSYMPKNLPERVWYFISSKETTSAQHGRWKAKGGACEIFSNTDMTGWKTTLEFYEGQVPHERKTDWIMQEFTITQKKLRGNKKDSLCRVFLSGNQCLNYDKQLNMSSPDTISKTQSHSMQMSLAKVKDDASQGSISKPQVNDDNETRASAVVDRSTNQPEDNLPGYDYISEGNFLELQDLDCPVSLSSSSVNSSCMTMSSDEYFDSDDLLRELEPRKTNGVGPENAVYKYSFPPSNKPNEVVMFPSSSINIESSKPETGEILETKCSVPGSSMVNRQLVSKALMQGIQGMKADYRDEGPTSNSHSLASPSLGHSELQNGEKKAGIGRMKKLKRKYFCFMPF